MKSYCLKCRKDSENINPKVSNTRNVIVMILSKCAICGSKKVILGCIRYITKENLLLQKDLLEL